MKLPLTGRAELLRALARGDESVQQVAAELLGFEPAEPPWHGRPGKEARGPEALAQLPGGTASAPAVGRPFRPADVPFWRAQSFRLIGADDEGGGGPRRAR